MFLVEAENRRTGLKNCAPKKPSRNACLKNFRRDLCSMGLLPCHLPGRRCMKVYEKVQLPNCSVHDPKDQPCEEIEGGAHEGGVSRSVLSGVRGGSRGRRRSLYVTAIEMDPEADHSESGGHVILIPMTGDLAAAALLIPFQEDCAACRMDPLRFHQSL